MERKILKKIFWGPMSPNLYSLETIYVNFRRNICIKNEFTIEEKQIVRI